MKSRQHGTEGGVENRLTGHRSKAWLDLLDESADSNIGDGAIEQRCVRDQHVVPVRCASSRATASLSAPSSWATARNPGGVGARSGLSWTAGNAA